MHEPILSLPALQTNPEPEKKLYIVEDEGFGLKIGQGRPHSRLGHFQTGNARPLRIVHVEETEFHAKVVETAVHDILAAHHIRGEWYDVTLDQVKAAIRQATDQIWWDIDRRVLGEAWANKMREHRRDTAERYSA